MPKLLHRNPAYRKHRASGQAIVTIDGHDHYLGPYGTRASRSEYDRVIAEWLAAGRRSPVPIADLTIAELMVLYLEHCKTYYRRPDGTPTNETDCIIQALRPLKELYSRTRVADFGPLALKTVRQAMIKKKWARTRINMNVGRIKRFFKWGVENEKVPASILHGLQAVQGLRAGRSEAKESDPVGPVPDLHFAAARSKLSPMLQDMVDLQFCTGMRPGELVAMRSCDIDTSAEPWVYEPPFHKTHHHGHKRLIYLGPKAQKIIGPRLKPNLAAAIFSPIEAEQERHALQRENRKTKVQPCQILRAKRSRSRKAKRAPQEFYSVTSYRRAIARACETAFAMPAEIRAAKDDAPDVKAAKAAERRKWRAAHVWHPHQLRHSAATRLRREFGLEAAQVILGHKTLTVTQVYAEKNVEAARRVMAEVG